MITRRPSGSHLEGLWEFPGGKVEPGECPESAVEREVLEETGLKVSAERQLLEETYAYPERTVRLHFLSCALGGGSLAPSLQNARWIRIADLVDLPMPAANAGILTLLLDDTRRG